MAGKLSGVRRAPGAVRTALVAAYRAAVAAVAPAAVAARALTLDRDARRLVVGARGRRVALPLAGGLVVIGAGKGAAGLAAGVEAIAGPHIVGGCVIVPPGYERPLARIRIVRGSHPLPDATSIASTRRLLAELARHPAAAVLVVLTGGASSLLVLPAAGLALADVQRAGRWILASGLDIAGANAIRKHLSAIAGGRLAARLVGRAAAALVVADVPGDDLAVIGSGPTVADPTTFARALALARGSAGALPMPPRVLRHLERGARGRIAETPKPGSAAARAPVLWIAGGETTVRLGAGAGKGGRNQALALAVARELGDVGGWALLAAGTDGIDGPTDAAGGFADGSTARRAARRPPRGAASSALSGAGPGTLERAIDRHDAYPLLAALGDLFRPGPTGTNVADLVIGIVWQDHGWRLPRRVIKATSRR